jgi:hypothetical protein
MLLFHITAQHAMLVSSVCVAPPSEACEAAMLVLLMTEMKVTGRMASSDMMFIPTLIDIS